MIPFVLGGDPKHMFCLLNTLLQIVLLASSILREFLKDHHDLVGLFTVTSRVASGSQGGLGWKRGERNPSSSHKQHRH